MLLNPQTRQRIKISIPALWFVNAGMLILATQADYVEKIFGGQNILFDGTISGNRHFWRTAWQAVASRHPSWLRDLDGI
jgi:hypothetical protein